MLQEGPKHRPLVVTATGHTGQASADAEAFLLLAEPIDPTRSALLLYAELQQESLLRKLTSVT